MRPPLHNAVHALAGRDDQSSPRAWPSARAAALSALRHGLHDRADRFVADHGADPRDHERVSFSKEVREALWGEPFESAASVQPPLVDGRAASLRIFKKYLS